MTVQRDKSGKYQGLKCDRCDTFAPSSAEILAGHGLNNMGWFCSGGSHLCPVHAPEPARA